MSRPAGDLIIIGVPLELGLVALWMAVGSGRQRRSHFWARVLLGSLGLPGLLAMLVGITRLGGADGLAKLLFPCLFLLGVVALMLVPGLLYLGSDVSPGPSDSDGGGGGGPGPPPPAPEGPCGGVPLPDADQASARARDHNTPRFDRLTRRRPAHAPGRAPARTNG